uniref:Uncharacterized protein n=1 Tax=viral metagenome TaxID=1070528 RepID=A0A6C0M138_9ZZZZ
MVQSSDNLKNGTMLIGVDYKCENDLNRNIIETLHPDFCWADHPNDCKGKPDNQWYQLYFPFQIHMIPELNRFKLIVFDASTAKFLFKIAPSFIAYLYYYFLEPGGELFFNFKENSFNGTLSFLDTETQSELIQKVIAIREVISSLTHETMFFGKKFIIPTYAGNFTGSWHNIFAQNIISNNLEYLRQHLIGSTVEYIEADEQKEEGAHERKNPRFIQPTYPIPLTNYSIGSYLKVTKRTDTDTTDEKVLHAVYSDAKIYETLYQQLKSEWIRPLILHQSFNDSYSLNCVFV